MARDHQGGRDGPGTAAGWHVPDEELAAYLRGALPAPRAWSVEAHVPGCSACAGRVADGVRAEPALAAELDRVRAEVLAQAGSEAAARARTGARPVSRAGRVWRVLSAAPALRLPWLAAAVCTVTAAALLSLVTRLADTGPVLLLIAPLLPLAGVAASYGPAMDPAHELTVATPFSGLRLLLARTFSVLAVTIPLLLVGSWLIPRAGLSPAAWLLPALGLVLASLAAGSWIDQARAAALAGLGWVLAVLAPRLVAGAAVPPVFTPAAEGIWAAVAVLGAGLLAARRANYDRMEG
jgi:anti-sigma factor RsiW